MKARLAVFVVAVVLAVGGALHLAGSHAARSAAGLQAPPAAGLQAPPNPIATDIDPGGWWDWH